MQNVSSPVTRDSLFDMVPEVHSAAPHSISPAFDSEGPANQLHFLHGML